MESNPFPFTGLSDEDVLTARKTAGANINSLFHSLTLWDSIKKSVLDPIFLLLLITAVLYLLLGEKAQAIFMLIAMLVVTAIAIYQERRSENALAALQKLTAPKAKVIRNNQVLFIDEQDVVPGDYIVAEEGITLAADGTIVYAHDFAVNESLLTGEAAAVYKNTESIDKQVYQGTTAVSGLAVYKATQTGLRTKFGAIAKSLAAIKDEVSPLQLQINRFVKRMSIAGGGVFFLIWIIQYTISLSITGSLLKALTLAMSILPEEIPVAFTTFMALGAWRLMQKRILAKDVKTVEALGAANVICLDKTGTITENTMELGKLYVHASMQVLDSRFFNAAEARELITWSMWASEAVPFDPMEKSLHEAYGNLPVSDERKNFTMEHEYPLEGAPAMMTHIFNNNNGQRIIAAKGAPERILRCCKLPVAEQDQINTIIADFASKGYRVLGIAKGNLAPNLPMPARQDDFDFNFLGLVAFIDPVKPGISDVFNKFYQAGIIIKIITGDNTLTTKALAKQAGLQNADDALDGAALTALDEDSLKQKLRSVNIFTRMFPEVKLRIIQTLKNMQYIVAMTGDGVNDAPALKAAHIGIAMGKRGSETAREAASLILLDDDLDKMAEAIAMGRQIYLNLKKAIGYIISIHIPIILVVLLPLVLNWVYPNIFTPVHVVFLELIMGPTCSIVYENEPMEEGLMQMPPRSIGADLLTLRELSQSILQGIAITAGALLIYQVGVGNHFNEDQTRTIVFITLVAANICLTIIDRSLLGSLFSGLNFKNWLLTGIVAATVLLTVAMLTIPFLKAMFRFELPGTVPVIMALLTGLISVIWYVPLKRWAHQKK